MANKKAGGLGRGLAALIPTDERPHTPRLGDAAADIIIGGNTIPSAAALRTAPHTPKKKKDSSRTAAATAAKKEKTRSVGAVYRECFLLKSSLFFNVPRGTFIVS